MRGSTKVTRLTLLLSSTAFIGACGIVEPYSAPQADLPGAFAGGGSQSVGEVADIRWWEAFGDRQLNDLASRGLGQNLTIRIAQERFQAAAAAARGAGVALTGDINGNAGFRGGSNAPEESFGNATFQASWLLDFFGRLSGQRAEAEAELEAAGYGVEQARLAYLAALTVAYIDMRFAQNSLELTRKNLRSRRETLRSTEELAAAQEATEADLNRVRGLLEETQAELPRLEAQFRIAAHRVATLLGQPAGSLLGRLSQGSGQPTPRAIYAAGVPADLLRNRPDIKVAERNLAAAVARIGIARSDLYPSITLNGRITAFAGSDSRDGTSWSFGPGINLPIFGREALTANVSAREANAREAWLAWQQTVLNGVEEVENALVSVNRSRATVEAERRAVATLEEAARLSREIFRGGNQSVLEVIDAERRVGDARLRLAAALRQYAVDFVALNVAIGAGRGFGPGVATASEES